MIIIITHYSKNTHIYIEKMDKTQTLQQMSKLFTHLQTLNHQRRAAACCIGSEN